MNADRNLVGPWHFESPPSFSFGEVKIRFNLFALIIVISFIGVVLMSLLVSPCWQAWNAVSG
jgi:hypothetical protein